MVHGELFGVFASLLDHLNARRSGTDDGDAFTDEIDAVLGPRLVDHGSNQSSVFSTMVRQLADIDAGSRWRNKTYRCMLYNSLELINPLYRRHIFLRREPNARNQPPTLHLRPIRALDGPFPLLIVERGAFQGAVVCDVFFDVEFLVCRPIRVSHSAIIISRAD